MEGKSYPTSAKERIAAGQYVKEKDFWITKLSGEWTKSFFYYDYKRTGTTAPSWDSLTFRLSGQLFAGLERLSNQSDARLHMVLTAGLVLLINKYTGNEDIIIGAPVYKQEEDVKFVNTVLTLRNFVHETMTFKELLLQVRQTLMEAAEHANYPGEILAEQLGMPVSQGEDFPLFDVSILLENVHDKKYLHHISHNMKFLFLKTDRHIRGTVEYNPSLYRKESVKRMADHFGNILQKVLPDVNVKLTDVELLTGDERKQVLNDFNRTTADYPADKTIHRWFEEQVERTPHQATVSSPLDTVDIHEALTVDSIEAGTVEKIAACCFKKSPYIFQADLDGPGETTGLKLLKSHQHNSVIVNNNLWKLIQCFDGETSVKSMFYQVRKHPLTFLIYSMRQVDLLEITFAFNPNPSFFSSREFGEFVSLVQQLYRNYLIEFSGISRMSQGETGTDQPLKEAFDPHESLAAVEGKTADDLLKQTREKRPTQVDVLLLGDTPGMPSTGLLYLASYLKRHGIQAYCHFNDTASNYKTMKETLEQLLGVMKPKVVAVSMKWFLYTARVIDICRIVKTYAGENKRDIKVVVGGNTASYYREKIIQYDCIDYLVRGDGEVPLLKLCRGEEPVPNCVYKKKGKNKEDWQMVETPVTYVQSETNSREIYLSHLDEILLSPRAALLGTFFIYTHKGCAMNCFYCGGCSRAQQETFNRKTVFKRRVEEVRKDILAARPFTSTFQFEFDIPGKNLLAYCRQIWEGIDLSGHFCVFSTLAPPAPALIRLVTRIFKYVYWDFDVCTLSERHRMELYSRGLVKPQPTDEEILAFMDECEKYDNIEVRLNLINGLPYFTPEDIAPAEKFLSKVMNGYSSFGQLHWARLHAQPGAPIVEDARDHQMYSYAVTFEDFLEYSEKNFNQNTQYADIENQTYPYIYFNDDELNSRVTRFYFENNLKIEQHKTNKRQHRNVLERLTYDALNRNANRLARVLRAKGVGPDTIVGILSGPSLEIAVAMLAILKAGGGYLPIDPEYPAGRIKYMLDDSNCRLVLAQDHLIEKITFTGEVLSIDVEKGAANRPGDTDSANLPPVNEPGSIVYTIYTSGTTGKPKGVVLEHQSLVNYVNWFTGKARLAVTDKTLLASSYAFDLGYTSIFTSLLNGGELHIISRDIYLSDERLLNYIRENEITYLKVTPSLFTIIANNPDLSETRCKKLRLVVLGGEPINVEDVEKVYQTCPHIRFMNHYGPTEATIGCIARFIDVKRLEEYKKIPSIGTPIHNTAAAIIDKRFNLLPVGVPGELCISGTCLARGYLNRPELTNSKFQITNYKAPAGSPLSFSLYRTGDLARWLPDGSIDFIGRIDQQVKIRGYRIELGEIQNRLLKHDRIEEAVVVDRESDTGDRYLCAYFVPGREEENRGKNQILLSLREIREKENLVPEGDVIDNPDASIVNSFEAQVKKNRDKIAIKSDGKSLTFDSLNAAANRLARLISERYNDRYRLSKQERHRYSRQILLDQWGIEAQEKLKSTTVFVAGAGGGASPTITQLALAGVGTIIVCDYDHVELSNLNRQFLHDESRIGMNKALSAKMTIERLNPNVNVIAYQDRITSDNVFELVADADIIFDMLDGLDGKFVLSECAVAKQIPHIIAAMTDINSYAVVLHVPHTPCFHCLYDREKFESIDRMKEYVRDYQRKPLHVVASSLFVGTGFAVTEAFKILLGFENPAYNKYFLFNQRGSASIADSEGFQVMTYPYSNHFRKICKEQGFDWEIGWRGQFLEELAVTPDPDCPLCGVKGKKKVLALRKKMERVKKNIGDTTEPIPPEPGNECPGTVALLLEQGLDLAAGIMGTLKSGKTYLPLDPGWPKETLRQVLEDSGARLVITNDRHLQLAKELRDHVNKNVPIINRDETVEGIDDSDPVISIQPDQAAYFLYPSSTPDTDAAAGIEPIMESHSNVLHFINAGTHHWQSGSGEAISPFSAYGFNGSMMAFYNSLLKGETYSYDSHSSDNSEKPRDSLSELQEYLSGELPDYMIPAYFVQLDKMPLTPNGKLDKRALPEPGAAEEVGDYTAPRDEIEEKLAEIWAELLGMEKTTISINANFFQLGGHSLKVTQLVSKVQKEMNATLPLSEVFKKPDIRSMAEFLKETAAEVLTGRDENLVLLKKGTGPSKHFFMIHAGGGEVDIYIEFCNQLKSDFNYWGIKATPLENYTPLNLKVAEVASKYVEKIRKIQPTGPYYIKGWCVGGTIAFEMVRQLEQMNETTAFFALINSIAPNEHLIDEINDFTLESELNWLMQYLPDKRLKEKLSGVSELNQLWPFIADHLVEIDFDAALLRQLIPENMAAAIQNINQLGIKEMIYYLNVVRTHIYLRDTYVPALPLQTQVHFFSATRTHIDNRKVWARYCSKPVKEIEITGDHFSIFRPPEIVPFAHKFEEIIHSFLSKGGASRVNDYFSS